MTEQRTSIPKIKLANLLPGAKLVAADERGVNETFIGAIDTHEGVHRAYVKALNKRQLVNELISATLGRASGLLIPESYLVRARKVYLQGSTVQLTIPGNEILMFGSVELQHPSLKRRLRQASTAFWDQLWASWKSWYETAIFDE